MLQLLRFVQLNRSIVLPIIRKLFVLPTSGMLSDLENKFKAGPMHLE